MINVSIIVPVYNAEKYLNQALDSLVNQSEKNIEIICVDDGSTDMSFDILCDYAKKDKRIKVIQNFEISDGAALARNIGMDMASGEYLAFLDADDFANENMVEMALKKARETRSDILFFDAWGFDDVTEAGFENKAFLNKGYLPREESFAPIDYKDIVFKMTHGAVWGRLFRSDFIKENRLRFFSCYYWDDIEFFYLAFCLAKRVTVLCEKLMHYRWNAENNQTSHALEHAEIAYKAPMEIRRRFEEYGIFDVYKKSLINHLMSRAFSIFNKIENVDSFNDLYWNLKNEYLVKIGAFEIEDDDYDNQSILKDRDLLFESTDPEDYLLRSRKELSFGYSKVEKIFSIAKNKIRVVIYGAGKKGKAVFANIMNNRMCDIVDWVDMNYDNIGFPVGSPDRIRDENFDFVFVCIADKCIFSEVRDSLMAMGVSKHKIIDFYGNEEIVF